MLGGFERAPSSACGPLTFNGRCPGLVFDVYMDCEDAVRENGGDGQILILLSFREASLITFPVFCIESR